MHIATVWKSDKKFNVELSSKEGAEAFLSIRGCRIAQGNDGDFVGFPADKNEQTGKWWNHVWANDKFAATVLELAKASRSGQQQRKAAQKDDSDIPF